MSADFSRTPFDSKKHYSGVLMQQGRVQLDADWNEGQEIQHRRWRAETTDVVGRCGVPEETPAGFEIANAGGNLTIGRGRIYVDGLLAENHGDGPLEFDSVLAEERGTLPVPLDDQPYPPDDGDLTAGAGLNLVYVDVWGREVTHLESPDLVEKAVGVDTSVRRQTVWQVKVLSGLDGDETCATPDDQLAGWLDTIQPSGGRLSSGTVEAATEEDPCNIPPEAGYKGLDNHLYRIEVHEGGALGTATFKWSRDNATVSAAVTAIDADELLTVSRTEWDPQMRFNPGDWVEITDDRLEFAGLPGDIRQIAPAGVDDAARTIRLTAALTTGRFPVDGQNRTDPVRHTRIRRWDQSGEVRDTDGSLVVDLDASGADGLIPIPSDGSSIVLERGIHVTFDIDATVGDEFKVGDYWLIAARAADGSIDELLQAPPQGIHHHFCRLALVEADATGNFIGDPRDCRPLFPPLTDLPLGGCCVRVEPDDDLQRAIDTAIENGGGCICLARGLHEVEGPLLIRDARNLSVHGESYASVLRLRGVDENGLGGIVLRDCNEVKLHNMTVVGQELPALVQTDVTNLLEPSRAIGLHHLKLLNLTQSAGDVQTACAVRLANVVDVEIAHCDMVAEVGVVSLFGQRLPTPFELTGDLATEYGDGVHELSMQRTRIRYQHAGVWSLRSDGWSIQACDVRRRDDLAAASMRTALSGELTAEDFLGQLFARLDGVIVGSGGVEAGTAIKAYVWREVALRDCRLEGARGLDAWWWFRGDVTSSTIVCGDRGLHAAWLHDTRWSRNRIRSSDGSALSFVGSYRARINGNHVRSDFGLVNLELGPELVALVAYLAEVAAFYGPIDLGDGDFDGTIEFLVFYMLLSEVVGFSATRPLFDAWQPLAGPVDPLGWVAYLLYAYLVSGDEPTLAWLPPPVIDLRVGGNDIEAESACVLLEGMLALGGAAVGGNRLHSTMGQALRVNAHIVAANPHLMIAGWRVAFAQLINEYIPEWVTGATDDPELSPDERAAWLDFLEALDTIARRWAEASEAFLEADYRVESNSVRSLVAAVESNIWGIAIQDNHITLRELAFSNQDVVAVSSALMASEETAPLAFAIRDGSRRDAHRAVMSLGEETILGNREVRGGAAGALFNASTGITNMAFAEEGTRLAEAINVGDRDAFAELAPTFVLTLADLFESYGIWAKGVGCRISRNHVLVPEDADESSVGRGGIKLSTDAEEDDGGFGLIALALLLGLLDVDPLLGLTETLIENNEVIGGFGHGIQIIAPIQFGHFDLGLVNLKIRGNEVTGMAGAGIVIDGDTLAVGVDIVDNKIAECSAQPELAEATNEKGGIVAENAGLCRVLGNQVRRCGAGQDEIDVFGMEFTSIYGLSLSDNSLLHNGANPISLENGGIRIAEAYGDVSVSDNQIQFQRGVGLAWANGSATPEESPLPASLIANVNFHLARAGLVPEMPAVVSAAEAASVRGRVQGNQFRVIDGADTASFDFLNIQQLDFSGNSCTSGSRFHLGTIKSVTLGLVSGNTLRTEAEEAMIVCKMAEGIIAGNVGNSPIRRQLSDNVQIGLNVPAVVS